jgi:hypothetical protein
MEKINKIIILCYKYDFYLTRICVASIRYYYPDIEICLIKDYKKGDFSTKELETNWNVKIIELERKKFGCGFAKFEPLFFGTDERVLLIDSDIVFIGRVLDNLEKIEADFIVSGDVFYDFQHSYFKNNYYLMDKLLEFDKDFKYPGFVFNAGNIVLKTNLFERKEFENFIDWNVLPKLKFPNIFRCDDQGVLNYVVAKRIANNTLKVANINFMMWGHESIISDLNLDKIIDKSNTYPFIIHWAGTKHYILDRMCRSDILIFFENYYYSAIKYGKFKKLVRRYSRKTFWLPLSLYKFLKSIFQTNVNRVMLVVRKYFPNI